MNNIKQEYREKFLKAFDALNDKQKQAVENIEGPVMVVAGPGTGKTQLLAIRVGYILDNMDVSAQNILCLTYTDAGTIAMRNRLLEFIGPEAHNVQIFTFHAFCNMVIKDNPDAFGSFRDLQVVSDLEKVEILREILDELPQDHILKKFKGNLYSDRMRLDNLFNLMKQEDWSVDFIRQKVEERNAIIQDKDHPANPHVYKRKTTAGGITYHPGDLKTREVTEETEKNLKLLAGAELINKYEEALKKRERFDYADMILWVIEKFRSDDYLLGKYQEKYQYIMVDEYQDTNGAQNELLFLLAGYWESPNLFIVGDDDQSIFRFQGANMNSIIEFRERFNPLEIVLTDNFRSSQIILDTSKKLIENNSERLVRKYTHLTKNLEEKRTPRGIASFAPQFIEYANPTQEEAGIVMKIEELASQNVPYSDIAVIYTKNDHGVNLIQYFMARNIPVNVKKKVNILEEIDIQKLINLLAYLNEEFQKPFSADYRLFEILHYSYFGIHALDAALLSLHRAKRLTKSYKDAEEGEKFENIYFRRWIADKSVMTDAGIQDTETFLKLSALLERWISDIPNHTVQGFIEKVITESGILDQALRSPESRWKLQLLNSFFDFVKSEAARKPKITLSDLLHTIELMEESELPISLYRIMSDNNGINFMTAHGSKGLEFEHVFIIKCIKDNWENKRNSNNQFTLPPNLTSKTTEASEEDDRRLFYVAMTRSKHYLYIGYYKADDKEKEKEMSKFISECMSPDDKIMQINVPDEVVLRYKAVLMRYKSGQAQLIDNTAVQKMLENFRMSNTNLNKYLECPLSFYFDTVLRVPEARSKTMGFGNAVHYALEKFVKDIKSSNPRSYGSLDKLLAFFREGMEKYKGDFTDQEFGNYSTHGVNLLSEYYEKYKDHWLRPKDYELEFRVDSVQYEGVPLRGFIDKIEIYDNHIVVVDYKTGNFNNSKLKKAEPDKNEIGGDYWRQIVFYKILLDSQRKLPYAMKEGIMDFVEKDRDGRYHRKSIVVEPEDVAIVTAQLKDAYAKIMNRQFTPGCEKPDCKWCNFVNKNMSIKEMTAITEEDTDRLYESAQENYEPVVLRD